MTAKELFVEDLKKIQKLLADEQPNSDGWWKIKELRNQCQISWGQSANMAQQVALKNVYAEQAGVFEEVHPYYYQYLTAPYREWIDSITKN